MKLEWNEADNTAETVYKLSLRKPSYTHEYAACGTFCYRCCELLLTHADLPASVAKKGHVLGILAGRDGRDAFKAVLHGSNFFKNFSLLPGTHACMQAGRQAATTTHSHSNIHIFTALIVATLPNVYMYVCVQQNHMKHHQSQLWMFAKIVYLSLFARRYLFITMTTCQA